MAKSKTVSLTTPITIRPVGPKAFKFEIWGHEYDEGPFETSDLALSAALKRVGVRSTYEDRVGSEKIQMDMT